MRINSILVTFILTFLLSGCVGTIKDKSAKTSTTVAATTTATFAGVVEGGAISHDRIWVKFKPATGGSGQFYYLAYLNGSPIPSATLDGDSVALDDQGYIVMTISNLDILTSYGVRVRLYDEVMDMYDTNTNSVKVWTGDDYRPVFNGVSIVENFAGTDAMTKLRVRWIVATTDSSAPFDAKYSVSGYKVYYSTSASELWGILRETDQNNINMAAYPNTTISTVLDSSASEITLSDLSPNTVYYVAVRAVDSDSTPRYELNYSIKSGQTYKYRTVEFAGLTSASTPKNSAGFSQATLSWNQCVGCGIYKVYAKQAAIDTGSIHPVNDIAYLLGTVTNLALTSTTFSGLTKNTSYKIYMVACVDATCGWDGSTLDEREIKGRDSSLSLTTTPPIAPFAVEPPSPTPPSGEDGLVNLDITWQMDIAQGYYTRVRIFRVLDKNGDISNYNGVNFVELFRIAGAGPYIDPTINTTPLDYVNNPTSARITNLTMDTEYCFQVLPFIESPDLDAGQEITLAVADRPPVVCGTPVYSAPVFGVTSLFPSCSAITATSLTLSWTHPETKNVITHYEAYSMLSTAGVFVFDDGAGGGAWNSGAGYTFKALVLESQNSTTISGLAPGTQYVFGVNTYYDPPGAPPVIRKVPASEATPGNEALIYCTTTLPDVDHGGWRDVFAVGPKIDGLTTNSTGTRTVVPEFMLPDRRIPYEYGQRTSLIAPDEAALTIGDDGNIPGTGSTTGIVRLKWADFQINGSSDRISDYWSTGMVGLGYYVYRVALEDIPASDRPPGTAPLYENIMESDNVNWALATKLRFVVAEHTSVAAQTFNIAYTSDAINNDTNNGFLISSEYATTVGTEKQFEIVDYPPESGKTYFYKVVAVFGGGDSDFADPKQLGNVIEVVVPPDNMALTHRWMANIEICGNMNRGVGDNCKSPNKIDDTFDANLCSDPVKNYRCAFDGLGSLEDGDNNGIPDPYDFDPINPAANFDDGTTRYYDYVRSILIDRFESGCNFTMTGCPTGDDGDSCIGSVNPGASDGNIGTVYYNYSTGYCMIKYNSTTWQAGPNMDPATTIPTYASVFTSNNAYLPPMVYFSQEDFGIAYTNQTTTVDGTVFSKRMPMKKEITAAFAWYGGVVSPEIHNMEAESLSSIQDCNSRTTEGGTASSADFTTNEFPRLGFIRTGSNGANSSALCVSRYGLQDHVGNEWEIMADRLSCNDTTLECSARPDDPNPNLASFTPLDQSSGVSEAQDITWRNGDGYYFGELSGILSVPYQNNYYRFQDMYFSFAQGVPLNTPLGDDDNKLATIYLTGSAPINYAYLNDDYLYLDNVPTIRAVMVGACVYEEGPKAGRFAVYVHQPPTAAADAFTSRAVVALPINY